MNTENTPPENKTTLFDTIIETLTGYYSPACSMADADETKTTAELVEEMESVMGIQPVEVSTALAGAGFKLHYTGTQYVWLLKSR